MRWDGRDGICELRRVADGYGAEQMLRAEWSGAEGPELPDRMLNNHFA
jgi:hypothetical protein